MGAACRPQDRQDVKSQKSQDRDTDLVVATRGTRTSLGPSTLRYTLRCKQPQQLTENTTYSRASSRFTTSNTYEEAHCVQRCERARKRQYINRHPTATIGTQRAESGARRRREAAVRRRQRVARDAGEGGGRESWWSQSKSSGLGSTLNRAGCGVGSVAGRRGSRAAGASRRKRRRGGGRSQAQYRACWTDWSPQMRGASTAAMRRPLSRTRGPCRLGTGRRRRPPRRAPIVGHGVSRRESGWFSGHGRGTGGRGAAAGRGTGATSRELPSRELASLHTAPVYPGQMRCTRAPCLYID